MRLLALLPILLIGCADATPQDEPFIVVTPGVCLGEMRDNIPEPVIDNQVEDALFKICDTKQWRDYISAKINAR